MSTEKTKKTFSIGPITLLVCFVCLIGLSVSATYLTVRVLYQSQLDNKNQEVLSVQENNKALADQNTELRNSLQKLEDQYSKLDAQLSELEARKAGPQTQDQEDNAFKEVLVLKPTWVSSGETILAFDGNLRVVLSAPDKDKCQKDSAAVSYLVNNAENNKLCLQTGKPENFTYQGKNYLFNLSGIVTTAGVSRYCISISEVSGGGTP
jgi:TolA-binding protein